MERRTRKKKEFLLLFFSLHGERSLSSFCWCINQLRTCPYMQQKIMYKSEREREREREREKRDVQRDLVYCIIHITPRSVRPSAFRSFVVLSSGVFSIDQLLTFFPPDFQMRHTQSSSIQAPSFVDRKWN